MNEWISVEDELPMDDTLKVCRTVMTNCEPHRDHSIVLSRYYTPANMKTKMWSFEFGIAQPIKISHWCDLPKTFK